MFMPEAPIDEYGYFPARKRKIGFAKNRVVSAPAYNFGLAKNGDQYLFR